jgi:heme/copper-type cytochrome/quinol oxidase subunit 4
MSSSGGFSIPRMGIPRMPSIGMPRMPSMGMPSSVAPKAKKPSNLPTFIQIVCLIIFSGVLGTLLYYLHNKESDTEAIKNGIMVICVMIAAVGLASFLNMGINMYDFLISSEINILCLFLFLSYIGVTSLFSFSAFTDIWTFIKNLFGVFAHPTDLFSKGYSIIMPTIFLLIPLMVLVTNFIKASGVNMIGAIVGAALTVGVSFAVVYFIWPSHLTSSPIGGGNTQSLASQAAGMVSSALSSIRALS